MDQPKIPLDLILSSLAEDAEKAQARATKASEVLLSELSTDIAVTPYDVVYEEDRVKLKHSIALGDVYSLDLEATRTNYDNDDFDDFNHGQIGAVAQRLYDTLTGIQNGRVPDPFGWVVPIA